MLVVLLILNKLMLKNCDPKQALEFRCWKKEGAKKGT